VDIDGLPPGWAEALAAERATDRHRALRRFVAAERRRGRVWPPQGQVLTALQLTPLESVRVIVVGQDPYHGPGQAHGLAFSVRPGVPHPPSLRNIFRELGDDTGEAPGEDGCLESWARQGVLLLNAVLTVREGQAGSHRGRGWEEFTGAALAAAVARHRGLVIVAWGGDAARRIEGLDLGAHHVLRAPHPSPLSAARGFFGSRPFSRVNELLSAAGGPPIRWGRPAGAPA